MPRQKVEKTDILKASLKVFKQLGYHKTSMADIGLACGLLKGSIYHYFSSKEVLMEEVLQYLAEYYKAKVFSIASVPISDIEKLEFLAEKSEEIFLKDSGGCLMASIGLETVNVVPRFQEIVQEFFQSWIECFTGIFISKTDQLHAKALAVQSVAQIEGAVMLMQLMGNGAILKTAHERIIQDYHQLSQT